MSTNPNRPEPSDGRRERHKPETTGHERLHREGYQPHARQERHHGTDKHVPQMSLHDGSGNHVSRVHHVKKGETVWGIAHKELSRNHLHPRNKEVHHFADRIMKVNHLKKGEHLKAGSELLIPGHKHGHRRAHADAGQRHAPDERAKPHASEDKQHRARRSTEHARDGEKTRRPGAHPGREAAPTGEHRPRSPAARPDAAPSHGRPGRPGRAPARREAPQAGQNPDAATGPAAEREDVSPPTIEEVRRHQERPREGDQNTERNGMLSGKTIVIDPGHGGQDSGARVGGVSEKDVVTPYARLLAEKLTAAGAKVVFTRPIDHDNPNMPGGPKELHRRGALADQVNADAVIRIHANSAAKATNVSGLEAYWHDAKDKPLADALHGSILQSVGNALNDKGVKQKTFEMHPKAPSALIELGYMTNPQELARMQDPRYQALYVNGMVDGLLRYMSSRR